MAEGHDNGYGPFLVSSGPYMLEGSKDLDFSLPPERQRGASGYVPQKSITLVRNPSWQPAQDRLRPALDNRIEITLGGSLEDVSAKIDQGALDLIVHAAPPPQAPLEQIEAYRSDPGKGAEQHKVPPQLAAPGMASLSAPGRVSLGRRASGVLDATTGPGELP